MSWSLQGCLIIYSYYHLLCLWIHIFDIIYSHRLITAIKKIQCSEFFLKIIKFAKMERNLWCRVFNHDGNIIILYTSSKHTNARTHWLFEGDNENDTPMRYIALYFCHTMIASGESSYCFLGRRISSRMKTNSLDLVGRVGRDFYYFCKMEGECRFLLLEWHPLYRYSNAKTVAVWQ